jgi:outer membrane murein-binding lipoprotein Lpp
VTAKHEGIAVGWKWLAGILTSVLILGGGAWMTSVSTDGNELRVEVAQLKKDMGEKAADVKEIRKDIDAIKDSVKRQETRTEKIDDKLDKLKDLLQEEKFKARQHVK